jgi:hypothetical protein
MGEGNSSDPSVGFPGRPAPLATLDAPLLPGLSERHGHKFAMKPQPGGA